MSGKVGLRVWDLGFWGAPSRRGRLGLGQKPFCLELVSHYAVTCGALSKSHLQCPGPATNVTAVRVRKHIAEMIVMVVSAAKIVTIHTRSVARPDFSIPSHSCLLRSAEPGTAKG